MFAIILSKLTLIWSLYFSLSFYERYLAPSFLIPCYLPIKEHYKFCYFLSKVDLDGDIIIFIYLNFFFLEKLHSLVLGIWVISWHLFSHLWSFIAKNFWGTSDVWSSAQMLWNPMTNGMMQNLAMLLCSKTYSPYWLAVCALIMTTLLLNIHLEFVNTLGLFLFSKRGENVLSCTGI